MTGNEEQKVIQMDPKSVMVPVCIELSLGRLEGGVKKFVIIHAKDMEGSEVNLFVTRDYITKMRDGLQDLIDHFDTTE